MTFTATLQLSPSPGPLEDLLDGCADLLVTFEADPQVLMEPVETDWPPVMHRQGNVECDPASVVIESAVVGDWCEDCEGKGGRLVLGKPMTLPKRQTCPACKGAEFIHTDILHSITGKDLAKLKEECAEYAADRVADNGLEG